MSSEKVDDIPVEVEPEKPAEKVPEKEPEPEKSDTPSEAGPVEKP